MRALLFVALVACHDGRVDALQADVVPQLQRRIVELEAAVANLQRHAERTAWWCTIDGCARRRTDGATPAAMAFCRVGSESGPANCRADLDGCQGSPGVGQCVGVR